MILSSHTRSTRPPIAKTLSRVAHSLLRLGALLGVLVVLGGSLGCAFGEIRPHDPLQREYSLEEMQKRYTDLVRFGNFEMAAGFLLPENRKTFIHAMPNEDELRFVDSETDPFVLNEEMTESTIDVVYTAYSPWRLTQFELYETQKWTRSEGIGNHWTVESTFVGLEPYVKKRVRPTASKPEASPTPASSSN